MAIYITRRTKLKREMETVCLVTSFHIKHPDERLNQSVGIQFNYEDGTRQEMVVSLDEMPLLIERLQQAYARREPIE